MTKTDGAKFKIKETLLEFMKRKSIDQIKVIDITNELKINRSTFYLYYDSIYDPLQEIEDVFFEGFRKINRDFLNYPLDNKYFYIAHPKLVETLEYLRENSYMTQILFGPYGDATFQNKCTKLVSDFFYRKIVSDYMFYEDDLIESFLIGGLRELTVEWINSGMQLDNERFAILIYRLMFGFFKPALDEFKT
ncbi:MAG: TetR family transcriptional regulator C-terminal domain-containing protein [Erysipelotrichaceae bacterium]|nr:TetR family transcriptional regulator C-terminal domain-containing protein [Erysipelotrichaceae bacterium]